MNIDQLKERMKCVLRDMTAAAKRTDFIEAAALRDELTELHAKFDELERIEMES
jgi:excinuclease UvrABC helicase subunit UvrB